MARAHGKTPSASQDYLHEKHFAERGYDARYQAQDATKDYHEHHPVSVLCAQCTLSKDTMLVVAASLRVHACTARSCVEATEVGMEALTRT